MFRILSGVPNHVEQQGIAKTGSIAVIDVEVGGSLD